jgi:hypothetical protein
MSIVMHREVDRLFRQATEAWWRGRNVDASKKISVAMGILVFDFEFLTDDRYDLLGNSRFKQPDPNRDWGEQFI